MTPSLFDKNILKLKNITCIPTNKYMAEGLNPSEF